MNGPRAAGAKARFPPFRAVNHVPARVEDGSLSVVGSSDQAVGCKIRVGFRSEAQQFGLSLTSAPFLCDGRAYGLLNTFLGRLE